MACCCNTSPFPHWEDGNWRIIVHRARVIACLARWFHTNMLWAVSTLIALAWESSIAARACPCVRAPYANSKSWYPAKLQPTEVWICSLDQTGMKPRVLQSLPDNCTNSIHFCTVEKAHKKTYPFFLYMEAPAFTQDFVVNVTPSPPTLIYCIRPVF